MKPPESTLNLPGIGAILLPREFAVFTGPVDKVERRGTGESPQAIHARLVEGAAAVLTGSYPYADGIYRYCQRFERELADPSETAQIAGLGRKSAAFAELRRRKLHRLLFLARGDELVEMSNPPDTTGLQEWLEEPTGDKLFLIPIRRLQRILTDMRRAAEGIPIPALGGTITILPHVYVPADASVPGMFADYSELMKNRRVLDMGAGTGVLAILAAKLGAKQVVATDSNPRAVANARLNAKRLGVESIVDVRGPADLFDSVPGERFDIVLFNAPWIQGEPLTIYDTANYDPGYRVIDAFFRAVSIHLAPDGVILLQYSDISRRETGGSITHLHSLLAGNGFRVAASRNILRISRVSGSRERVYIFEIRKA